MPTIATDTLRYSNLIKYEGGKEVNFARKEITVNEGSAKSYVVGTVLGKVTATGKYKIAVQTASDGSQVPAAIVIEDKAIAASTDTKLVAIVRGDVIVSKDALVLDATYNTDAEKLAVYEALEALRILVAPTVTA